VTIAGLDDYRAPGEDGAADRAWPVVRDAFLAREPQRARRSHRRLVVVVAAAALTVAAVTPVGQAVGDFVREQIARDASRPETPGPLAVGTPGRLLLVTPAGVWVVRPDGSGRHLGRYASATWSAKGQFVAVTRDNVVYTVEAETGTVRWPLVRPSAITDVRWSGGEGFRIAYREGAALRVVNGNGTGDRQLVKTVGPVAPAWRPGPGHVLAYAAADGAIREIDVDTGAERELARVATVRRLLYTPDGAGLLALAGARLLRLDGELTEIAADVIAMATSPGAPGAVVLLTRAGQVIHVDGGAPRRIASVAGASDIAWSPDATTIIAATPTDDSWRVIDAASGEVAVIDDLAGRLDPDGTGAAGYPSIAGWCC
jgi:hypothetical protein